MEKIRSHFLDTYALIEIIQNNSNFERFKDTLNFTGLMNLLELYYMVTKDFGSNKADEIIDKLKGLVVDANIDDIKFASDFRIKHIKQKLSYIDCLGYAIAINRNMKFLTGDKEFEKISNVEFVK